uniref:Uncharacterized protein n=1 Tax=Oryza punctata TaxID=4537 RepID=A0A0E0JN84_ORYPU
MLSKAKVPIPKRLPEKFYLLELQALTLTLDHNHVTLATFVSCLLNSFPNLKDLRIIGSSDRSEFWEEKIDADCCVQNHMSSVTF